jgi:hypothetical protein
VWECEQMAVCGRMGGHLRKACVQADRQACGQACADRLHILRTETFRSETPAMERFVRYPHAAN